MKKAVLKIVFYPFVAIGAIVGGIVWFVKMAGASIVEGYYLAVRRE